MDMDGWGMTVSIAIAMEGNVGSHGQANNEEHKHGPTFVELRGQREYVMSVCLRTFRD